RRPRRSAAPTRPWGRRRGTRPGRSSARHRRRMPRGTWPAGRRAPSGRAGSCACRAVRPRVLPFPPLRSTFIPLALHPRQQELHPNCCSGTRSRGGTARRFDGGGRRLEEVVLPAGFDLAEGETEAVGGSERQAGEVEGGLLGRAMHLLGVAAPPGGHHVLPHVQATARSRDHVVEVLRRRAAVLALPRIA